MKKKLFLMCLVGLLSVSSAYAACEGGIEVTNTVGTTFCKSNVTMNWWSAFAWCRANGMSLATMYEMCPSWNGIGDAASCPELRLAPPNSPSVWSATTDGSTYAFAVGLSTGWVYDEKSRNRTDFFAFCR